MVSNENRHQFRDEVVRRTGKTLEWVGLLGKAGSATGEIFTGIIVPSLNT